MGDRAQRDSLDIGGGSTAWASRAPKNHLKANSPFFRLSRIAMNRRCAICNKSKPKNQYSINQWSQKNNSKCKACIGNSGGGFNGGGGGGGFTRGGGGGNGKKAPCKFHLSPQGCSNGANCAFSHDSTPAPPVNAELQAARNFLKPETTAWLQHLWEFLAQPSKNKQLLTRQEYEIANAGHMWKFLEDSGFVANPAQGTIDTNTFQDKFITLAGAMETPQQTSALTVHDWLLGFQHYLNEKVQGLVRQFAESLQQTCGVAVPPMA